MVAMVGGGQLARMTHQAAIALGQTLRVLAAGPDDPAAQVTPDVVIGAHTDLDALRRAADGRDAVTFDHEHVPTELLEKLVAEGVNVAPPPEALVHAQDKLVMRRRLEALGAPMPRYAAVTDVADVAAFAARVGGPVVLKTARGGYDGRGVLLARDLDEARDFAGRNLADGHPGAGRGAGRDAARAVRAGGPLAVRAGRGVAGGGDRAARRHLRRGARAGARPGRRARQRGRELALRLAAELGVVGVLAVELFETVDGVLWSTSWRCGRTTPGTGPWTAPAPASSSSTCARCSTTRSATPRRSRRSR